MIRYKYADQLNPPAPLINVSISCVATGTQLDGVPALIDTAADRTIVPGGVIDSLALVEDGRMMFQGFAGEIIELPTFLASIRIHDLPPQLVRVALGEREPFVLLGRDVLNRMRVLLDGPQLALEIHSS